MHISVIPAFTMAAALAGLLGGGTTQKITFDSAPVGGMPAGWSLPGNARWEVRPDGSAPTKPNVLAEMTAEHPPLDCPVAVLEKPSFSNGDVSVQFRSGKGALAGVVWRYRDPGNYYLARVDTSGLNVTVFRVANGQRSELRPKGRTFPVFHHITPGEWLALHVRFRGNRFVVYFNHREVFRVEDAVLPGPGNVGLWARGDGITHFDDFQLVAR